MGLEKINISILFKTVSELTAFSQASREVDFYYFFEAHKILKTFTTKDWGDLKLDLSNWNDKQLDVLVQALDKGDGDYNVVEDNFFIGYIFNLSGDTLASQILDQMLYSFFDENEIDSMDLLDSIENRIKQLYTSNFLKDKKVFAFWMNKIEETKEKRAGDNE
ncbi:hypothetical protein [Pedobacter sp. UBA5917]|jgi:hypothetical protein|uniref:hypothetical protein n=1 Tax=Pedobacter sp. UBA5917 TaxID=1947061 RepID=UPI0025DBE6BC|nr:hypothetical protein [Pedobacter sp. UBA5917]